MFGIIPDNWDEMREQGSGAKLAAFWTEIGPNVASLVPIAVSEARLPGHRRCRGRQQRRRRDTVGITAKQGKTTLTKLIKA
jgi:hypothetical protein